jgi:hypothetical protein
MTLDTPSPEDLSADRLTAMSTGKRTNMAQFLSECISRPRTVRPYALGKHLDVQGSKTSTTFNKLTPMDNNCSRLCGRSKTDAPQAVRKKHRTFTLHVLASADEGPRIGVTAQSCFGACSVRQLEFSSQCPAALAVNASTTVAISASPHDDQRAAGEQRESGAAWFGHADGPESAAGV